MKSKIKIIWVFAAAVLLGKMLIAQPAYAHEVYVLPDAQVQYDLAQDSPNPLDSLQDPENVKQLLTWGEVLLLGLLVFIFIPWKKIVPKTLQASLVNSRKYALPVLRIFLGMSLIFAGWNSALFGPELPLSDFGMAGLLRIVLLLGGAMLVVNLLTRWVSLVFLLIYIFAFFKEGAYLLTYFEYFAVFLLLVSKKEYLEKFAGLGMRLGLGLALLFTAISVKFLNSQVSLDVVNTFHLDQVFNFDPLLLVFAAGLIEIFIALFYILGLEVRLASLLFTLAASAAVGFFNEILWPHLILYGFAIAIFMYGYDQYALQRKFQKIE